MAMMSLCQRYSKKQGKKYKHTRLMLLGSWGALMHSDCKRLTGAYLLYFSFPTHPTQGTSGHRRDKFYSPIEGWNGPRIILSILLTGKAYGEHLQTSTGQ